MSVIDEIASQLSEAKQQIGQATASLQSFSQIRKSIEDAGDGLHQSISRLNSLSETLETASTSIGQAAVKLTDISDSFRQLDSAGIARTQVVLRDDIHKLTNFLEAGTRDLGHQISRQGEFAVSVSDGLRQDVKRMTTELVAQTSAAVGRSFIWHVLTILLLLANLGSLALLYFK